MTKDEKAKRAIRKKEREKREKAKILNKKRVGSSDKKNPVSVEK